MGTQSIGGNSNRLSRDSRWFWAGAGLIAVLALLMFAWRWERWGAFMIDTGRELYVPWRILKGEVLYKDLAWFNGPLSPYVNAFLFFLFGTGIKTLVLPNFLLLLSFTFFLYKVVAGKAGNTAATVCAVLFLTSFALGQLLIYDLFNYLLPYSYCATYGFYSSVLSVYFFSRGFSEGKPRRFVAGGFFLGLTYLTKPELFLAAFIADIFFLWLTTNPRQGKGGLKSLLLPSLPAFLVPPALAFLFLLASASLQAALKGIAGGWLHAFNPKLSSLYFYRRVMGILDPMKSLGTMGLSLVCYGIVFGAIYGVSFLPGVLKVKRRTVTGALLLALALPVLLLWRHIPFLKVLRPLTVILLVVFLFKFQACLKEWKAGRQGATHAIEAGWALFSLALLAKIFLNVNFYDYGFYLAVPGTMILVIILLERIPKLVQKRGGDPTVFKAGAIAIISVIIIYHLYLSAYNISFKDTRFGWGADALMIEKGEAYLAENLEEYIQTHTRENEPFLVFPEGVMLNYLFRRPTPTPFYNFMPPDIIMFGEENIIKALKKNKPRFSVLLPKYMPEYGVKEFGRGYAEKLHKWLTKNYTIIKEIYDPEMKKDYLIPYHFGFILESIDGKEK